MIKIVSIDYAGGACPYQLEGKTEDGQWFYMRYRGGYLCYVVRKTAKDRVNPDKPWYDFTKQIGDKYDGWASHEQIYPHIKDTVEFPEGFVIESYPKNEHQKG